MMLHGSNVDDTLFPLDALFHITRITKTYSSEMLDQDTCGRYAATKPWPVTVIEISSVSRFLDVMELLEQRGDLSPGKLEACVEEWAQSASTAEQYDRCFAAGEMLL